MKKIFFSFVALAALAACTKSEVAYEASAEIGFAPAVKNITKAAISGTYPDDQPLRVFANYGALDPETVVKDDNISSFATAFLNNVKFTKQDVSVGTTTVSAWAGTDAHYSWPNNGSLVFAGYAEPKTGTVGTTQAYDFTNDELTIEGYSQSTNPANTFDLAWFGRTDKSYNYKSNPTQTVGVTLSHALSWIEIYVLGEGTTVGDKAWKITSIVMNNVYNTGDVTCKGNGAGKASWENLGNTTKDSKKENSITIFSGEQTLTDNATICETANTDVLVIPQTPTNVTTTDGKLDPENSVATLTINYTYQTPADATMPTQTTIVPLVVNDGWKSGYKYKYTLTFKASEILITPTYGTWEDGTTDGVTVE